MALKFTLSSTAATAATGDVLVLPASSGAFGKQKPLAAVDKALDGALLDVLDQNQFEGKKDQQVDVPTLGLLKVSRVVVVGVGDAKQIDDAVVRDYVAQGVRAAVACPAKKVSVVLPAKADFRVVGEGAVLGAYQFDKYLTGDRKPRVKLVEVVLLKSGSVTAAEKKAFGVGRGVAEGVCHARDAVNEPPNELYPETLAALCRSIANKGKLKIKVLDKKGIKNAGMKLHYAVGQGSEHEPRLIHLSYVPKGAKKTLVFVGKGLTFDSGGLCIKPAPGMGEMKSDMGGAAAVLGLMAAVAAVKPSVAVHGIIGSAENMPDGAAYRPGDVFGSLDGKTVEIINTDAEGRLVLADALAYATKIDPDVIVDAATLTGAMVVALGKTCSGFYTADDKLGSQMEEAAKAAGEQFWRMPLIEELREQLKSDVADLKHTGERWGGSITAALFLREFVGDYPWIHCDIAGPVLADRPRGAYPKGGTGHAVLTFLRFVESFR